MASSHLLGRLARLNTNFISDALDSFGLTGATNGLLPLNHQMRIVGRASTVQLEVALKRKGRTHFLTPAIESIVANDRVLVIAGGVDGIACWDRALNAVAARHSLVGAVVDGMCRDGESMHSGGYPIYGAGLSAISAERRIARASTGLPVVMAGVVVHDDDYVIADRCGTVFIMAEMAESVITMAERIKRKKKEITAQIRAGRKFNEVDPERQLEQVEKPKAKSNWGKL